MDDLPLWDQINHMKLNINVRKIGAFWAFKHSFELQIKGLKKIQSSWIGARSTLKVGCRTAPVWTAFWLVSGKHKGHLLRTICGPGSSLFLFYLMILNWWCRRPDLNRLKSLPVKGLQRIDTIPIKAPGIHALGPFLFFRKIETWLFNQWYNWTF